MKHSQNVVCTIVAKNYLSFARTLFQSIRASNPDLQCYGLIVDDWQGFIDPAQEPFTVVSIGDIGIPGAREMAFKYDVTELSTAVKPFLLDHLLKQGFDRALYLDPDILVTNSLSELLAKLDGADFLVTPHLDVDYPDDAFMPNDKFIMLAGIYNLGFFGLRKSDNAFSFLDWWKHKLLTKCVAAPTTGYFVDQRFIDLAFGLFPGFEVVREPGYNAAYWNIHGRTISRENGRWRCNRGPLFFYHFSGYNPQRPASISKYINRYSLETRPDLRPLFEEYRTRLLENGYEATSAWPYSYASYSTGEKIDYLERQTFRDTNEESVKSRDPFTSATVMKKAASRSPHAMSVKSATRIYLGAIRQALFR
jgi:Nucleotide-diphospho-sugar transferase